MYNQFQENKWSIANSRLSTLCIIFRCGLLFFPFNCHAYKQRDSEQLQNLHLDMWEGVARTVRRKRNIGTGILTTLAKNK